MILQILELIVIAYVVGFIYFGTYRNITARIQGRYGPTIYQSFFDSIKLFSKKSSASFGWMFYLGPIIMATGAVMTLMFIPLFNDSDFLRSVTVQGNLFLLLYLMVLGPLGNALAVGTGGNPFGVMGVTRGLSRLFGLELPFYIAIVGLIIASNSADIVHIMDLQKINGLNIWNHPFLFIAAMISMVGFFGESPFDIPGAPQEVYSGPRTEFSGKFLALLMSQGSLFAFAKLVLVTDLFLGGADSLGMLLLKTFAIFITLIFIGIVYGRYKVSQAVDFLMKIPTLIGLIGLVRIIWFG
ncbi:respiratory chain complex I subunit 1 family protein [Sulfurospirillum sp. 1612]|uniref:respiratory chain complex I subunit 1 family protein n=1 Tax=Sulfurospirillum sp. 1612 TaxID=3094835 RepID=UPI002F951319